MSILKFTALSSAFKPIHTYMFLFSTVNFPDFKYINYLMFRFFLFGYPPLLERSKSLADFWILRAWLVSCLALSRHSKIMLIEWGLFLIRYFLLDAQMSLVTSIQHAQNKISIYIMLPNVSSSLSSKWLRIKEVASLSFISFSQYLSLLVFALVSS